MLEAVELSSSLSLASREFGQMPRYLWVCREERCVAHLPARIGDLTASLTDCARDVVSICSGVSIEGHCRTQRARVCGDLPFKLMTSLMVKARDT